MKYYTKKSSARVIAPMYFAKTLRINVRVDLRSANIGVAEHLLYRTDIRPVPKHVRGETMTQNVRRDAPWSDPYCRGALAHNLENALPRKWLS